MGKYKLYYWNNQVFIGFVEVSALDISHDINMSVIRDQEKGIILMVGTTILPIHPGNFYDLFRRITTRYCT